MIAGADSARPLHSWSSASLDKATGIIEPAWRRWCERWGVAGPTVLAVNACDAHRSFSTTAKPACIALSAADAWLQAEPSVEVWIRALLFGGVPASSSAAVVDPVSLADEIADGAWRDLRRCLATILLTNKDTPPSVDGTSMPPAGDAKRWSGAMGIQLSSASGSPFASLHLSFRSASRLVGGSHATGRRLESTGGALHSVLDAVGNHRLRLSVALDEVVLDFAALASLRCGDVLALSHPLDRALRVHALAEGGHGDPHDLCTAVLGARGSRRAVELICKPHRIDPTDTT